LLSYDFISLKVVNKPKKNLNSNKERSGIDRNLMYLAI
jgi:hypothetical protein